MSAGKKKIKTTLFWPEIKTGLRFFSVSREANLQVCQSVSTSERLLRLHARLRGAHSSQAFNSSRSESRHSARWRARSSSTQESADRKEPPSFLCVHARTKKVQNMWWSSYRDDIIIMTSHDSAIVMFDKTPSIYHPSFSKLLLKDI